jgi:FixJ family two-component response regulator
VHLNHAILKENSMTLLLASGQSLGDEDNRKDLAREAKGSKSDLPLVCVVDDDVRFREAISSLLQSAGIRVATFSSGSEFLQFEKPDCAACLILDLNLPDINGLELQEELNHRDSPPVVFLTGYGDVPSSVKAMKAGAIEFLSKPVDDTDLLRAIREGIALCEAARQRRIEHSHLQERYALLTPRERQILPFVTQGFLNKQTAEDLGIAVNTIGVHRGKIMRKLGAGSLAELVRMSDKLGIVHATLAR